jgi:ribose transport system permease protein
VVPGTREGRLKGVGAALNRGRIVLILLGLIIIFSTISRNGTFFSVGNLSDIALNTTTIVVLAIGQMYIVVAGGLDLSIGSNIVFCAVLAVNSFRWFSGPVEQGYPHAVLAVIITVPLTIVAGMAWGALNGWLIARWKIPSFIVTLGTLTLILGVAQLWTGGTNQGGVPPQIQEKWVNQKFLDFIPWPVVVTAIVVAIFWLILACTNYGLHTYALGANPESLRRTGVNVEWHTWSLYILMGGLVGLVAVMEMARFGSVSLNSYTTSNLQSIAAVIIGGTSLYGGAGKMLGTVAGAFIPAVLQNGFIIIGVSPFWQNIAMGLVLIIAVYLGQRTRKRARAEQVEEVLAESDALSTEENQPAASSPG